MTETIYLACLWIGLAVLLLQIAMMLFGGADHDVDAGHLDVGHADLGHADSGETHAGDSGMNLFSVRSISGFLAAFGLMGWGGTRAAWPAGLALLAALGAGAAMLVLVAWMFASVRKLGAQGNLDARNAVGRTARVYLRIPAQNAGKGKITVAIQGRSVEYGALTRGAEIATGAEVRVVKQITEDTFEVEAL